LEHRVRRRKPATPATPPRPFTVAGWPGNWWYWDPVTQEWVWFRQAAGSTPPTRLSLISHAMERLRQRINALWAKVHSLIVQLAEIDEWIARHIGRSATEEQRAAFVALAAMRTRLQGILRDVRSLIREMETELDRLDDEWQREFNK
jgi:hypothetical protein